MPASEAARTCETIEPLLAVYALGAGDAATRALISAHLHDCAACQQTLAAFHSTARLLPLGLSPALPTPELRTRVLDAVAAAAQGQPTPAPTRARLSLWFGRRWWHVLGALTLLVSLGLNGWLYQRLGTERAEAERQTTALTTLLQNASVERRTLAAASPAADARGTLLLAREQQTVAVVVQRLPLLPTDHVYQLWLNQHGQRTSAGTFTVAPDGCGFFVVQAPQPLDRYDSVGVTVEPSGGSAAPTSPRIIGGAL